MIFKIYYDDGSTFTGLPEDAPKYGVVAILQERTDGRFRIAHKADFYLYNGHWLELDAHGLVDYSINVPGHIVLAGRTIDPVQYDHIMEQARKGMMAESIDGDID